MAIRDAGMTIFEAAKARADETAPAPHDTPRAAAAIALGFGLAVIALFIALEWMGLPRWAAWGGAALAYGGIAWADCQHGWTRNREAYREAMETLKAQGGGPSVH
jgi:hypothetical protein